ncbi:hypothetical protein [Methanorbis rubei]|uniref:Uncharacterized protein n=1 Tax=Methanorbis rubei TaxID=3028300 RepID=A0AAE4MG70_9EURY|nr:hypothetical protein [Methanocorpusculaceae archaeon Cs1]
MHNPKRLLLTIFIVILILTAPAWMYFGPYAVLSYFNGEKLYTVSITGLEDANITEQVEILVPLPQMRNESMFPDSIYSQQFDGWTSEVRTTDNGTVLAFRSTSLPVKNLDAAFHQSHIISESLPDLRGYTPPLSMPPELVMITGVTITPEIENVSLNLLLIASVKKTTAHLLIPYGITYITKCQTEVSGGSVAEPILLTPVSWAIPWDVSPSLLYNPLFVADFPRHLSSGRFFDLDNERGMENFFESRTQV